jgi:hypothetical protein
VSRELEQALARERAAQEQIALLEQRLVAAEAAGAEAARLGQELKTLTWQHEELTLRVREAEATAAHFREVNDGLMGSVSWRVTRPLRALKRG